MEHQVSRFESTSVFLEHGYKELHIPPGPNGEFLLEKNALHIWPRHQFMMIALPNFDGSFTCTLFLAHKSVPGAVATGALERAEKSPVATAPGTDSHAQPTFDQLNNESELLNFFNREFPDAVPLIPTLVEDFFANPTGDLGTVKCWPWNVGGKSLLLGDSAHAVVPFYGQGMNCAFEDVRVLDSLIGAYGDMSVPPAVAGGSVSDVDWKTIYDDFGQLRKINTDAIADMAEENFYEMRDRVADPVFQRKRELETNLEQTYPDYFSKYSMVTFREDLPYSVAKEKGNAQDRLLMEICAGIESVSEVELERVMEKVRGIINA
jgi:kynurenine 3-monooxygenase